MQELQIFKYEDVQVRTANVEGEIFFFAQDVASILGYSATSAMMKRIDEDEQATQTFLDGTTYKKQSLINEPGLYNAVLGSQLASAKKFKKWVTSEVLPSIRKTGSYGDPLQALEDPAAMRSLLLTYSEKVIERDKLIAYMQPKVEALDRLSMADGSLCITNAAKSLQVQPKFLFNLLSQNKFIYRRPGCNHWIAYQDKLQTGYLEHKVTTIERTGSDAKTVEQVLVTPKGLVKLAGMISGNV